MAMITKLSHVTIVVRDQDAALRWYTDKLGLEKRMDEPMGPGMRWLTVGVPGNDVEIVLHRPLTGEECKEHIGPTEDDIGKSTMWVFDTDDCRKTYDELTARGVTFLGEPQEMPWGIQAIFTDLYGNNFVLIQPVEH